MSECCLSPPLPSHTSVFSNRLTLGKIVWFHSVTVQRFLFQVSVYRPKMAMPSVSLKEWFYNVEHAQGQVIRQGGLSFLVSARKLYM